LRYITFVLPTQVDLDSLIEHVRQTGTLIEETENGSTIGVVPPGWLVRDPSQNSIVFTGK
jgi:hypothetical protein